jgi:flagellar motor switch protein FliN/FliY
MATTQVTLETTAQTLAGELARVWGEKLGGAAALTPASGTTEAGWLITVATSGGASGQVGVWFQAKAAAAALAAGLKLNPAPADDAVSALLCEVVTQATRSLVDKSALDQVTLAPAAAVQGLAPAGADAFSLAIGGTACPVQVLVTLAPSGVASGIAPSNSSRIEAVLDVDLPLVVRFGRATMPLRALAVLGPGSVIDMGRSPDEPVELLVGERLIARGEVVIVGGNYGVRITTLTGSQAPEAEMEVRLS